MGTWMISYFIYLYFSWTFLSFQVVAESNPERFGWCLQYSSEVFMIFNLFIQHHYLSNYGNCSLFLYLYLLHIFYTQYMNTDISQYHCITSLA